MEPLQNRILKAIDLARKKKGYSVVELAEAIGVTRQSVYNWLKGKDLNLSGATLVELAELSGINARWIINGRGPEATALNEDEQIILRGFRLLGEEMRESWIDEANRRIARDSEKTNAA